ncbi:prepilin-type N-terminal cleavage/methylation domain-containing protein [Komagataeibacter oboediens]|uniref:prepilin-type N-terminal cleavage/methylation domain-containing protein n=1 Tax=Komagataeibacter oboediens TaxID=65958 RepID=UPI0023DB86D6|nr:prepilin-type N-terminal cleavage/methylation domain-containing protein [Komagataeibacter oboediens]WEQ51060.1 prepilin-type N-terminal cleavage/methylation domain-containing protein [Komagataeibacter oboediens]
MIRCGRYEGPVADAGFTLLELLVVLVIFGVLLATLTQGTYFGVTVFERQRRSIGESERLINLDGLLRSMIEQADPGSSLDTRTLTGTHHGMVFRTRLPEGAAMTAADRLADVRLNREGDVLLLSWLPHQHVLPRGLPGAPQRAVLLSPVSDMEISYFAHGQWLAEWATDGLPDLVRIRIVLPDQEKRVWPDIVIALIRYPRN